MGQKLGGPPLFREEERGPYLTQRRLGPGLYLRTEWYPDPSSRLAIIDMGRKVGRHIFNRQIFRETTAPKR